MFGRVGGGSGKRPLRWRGRRAPRGARPCPLKNCVISGAGPERNSTIQSAVSDRTSSVTSSVNRRRMVRHRSAASPAVPSAGPSTSRTLSDAQSNWRAWSRRCTACAVATSRIQPDVRPKYRSPAMHAAASSSDR